MTQDNSAPVLRPRLNQDVRVDRQSVFIGADAVDIRARDLPPAELGRILSRFDGTADFPPSSKTSACSPLRRRTS